MTTFDSVRGTALDGLRYEKRDRLAIVTIDRAERGNSLTPQMHVAMRAIWRDVQLDPAVRVAIITGTGDRHFSTGADVGVVASRGRVSQGPGPLHAELFWSPVHNKVLKPVICAVNGACVGGGLHFVADSDIVLAVPGATFFDTHVAVGMVGGVENTALAYRLPLGTVLQMTFMGKEFRLSAQRAHQLGLVDEIVPRDDLMTRAETIATTIASHSPAAVTRSKQAIWNGREQGYSHAAEYAWAQVRMHWSHPDFSEGPTAFSEGRPPRWQEPQLPGIEEPWE
jgi:enoyl-CoA hydratase/carnithine racemase